MNTNQSVDQLAALGRIVSQVKAYREDSGNYHQRTYGSQLNQYLQQRLSSQDLAFWQALQTDWERSKNFD